MNDQAKQIIEWLMSKEEEIKAIAKSVEKYREEYLDYEEETKPTERKKISFIYDCYDLSDLSWQIGEVHRDKINDLIEDREALWDNHKELLINLNETIEANIRIADRLCRLEEHYSKHLKSNKI